MSKYCMICRNTACQNHGKNITLFGDSWQCDYIPTPTNADRIRAMSDEELSVFLCAVKFRRETILNVPDFLYIKDAHDWLQQLAEEDT